MIMDLNSIVSRYRENGFVSGLPALCSDQVRSMRTYIEQLEMDYAEGAGGHSLNQFFRVNGHVVIPELAEMARNPDILDIIEAILGPDLLAWSVEFSLKKLEVIKLYPGTKTSPTGAWVKLMTKLLPG